MRAKRFLSLVSPLLAVVVSTADAATVAHFVARRVENVCAVDDSEPITAGDPDLRFRMTIYDLPSLLSCPSDDGIPHTRDCISFDRCGFVSTCGTWDFVDVEISKVTLDSSGAGFRFHLIDDDTDEDDYMGGWDKSFAGTTSGLDANNTIRNSVIAASVCNEAVEGAGWIDNYRLAYSISFTDTDGPLPLAAPVALENGLPTTVDDDLRLDFAWTPTDDPNTGISRYRVTLLDVNSGSYVFQDILAPKKVPGLSMCATGCDLDYEPVVGHLYLFMVSATNGAYPGITNQTTVESPFASVLVSGGPLDVEESPAAFALAAPYPNPTAGGAMVAYALPVAGPARLEVIDLQGRRVALLAEGTDTAGPHRIDWNGRDPSGQSVKPGAYWVRLQFANAQKLQRLVVIR